MLTIKSMISEAKLAGVWYANTLVGISRGRIRLLLSSKECLSSPIVKFNNWHILLVCTTCCVGGVGDDIPKSSPDQPRSTRFVEHFSHGKDSPNNRASQHN
jgi:hypothetical protein